MATGGDIIAEETDQMPDETEDFQCTLCKQKKKNQKAEKYCVDCKDNYCSTCVKFHEEIPALSTHIILEKDYFQPTTRQTQLPIQTERCENHNHNCVDMYCEEHNQVGCLTCMAIYHRPCRDISYIPELLTNKTNIYKVEDTEKKLQEIMQKVQQHKGKFESKRNKVLGNKEQLLQQVATVRESINALLDVLQQVSIGQIEETTGLALENIQDDLKELERKEALLTSATNNLVSTGNNISHDFVKINKSENFAKEVEKFLDGSKPDKQNEEIELKTNDILIDMLQEMESLVSLELKKVPISSIGNTDEESNQNQHLNKFKLKAKTLINVKHLSDLETPNIYSICFLQDGTLVLADFSNLRLKRVDRPGYYILDYCDIPGKPWQVCTMSYNEVAVSCSDSVLHFVSLQPKMKKTRSIRLSHSCRGLTYANGNLYLSDSTSVYVYNFKGKKLERSLKIPSRSCRYSKLFHGITGIDVTNDGSSIYVADKEKGLLVLDRKGRITTTFHNNLLPGANYVSVTKNGRVLVAGNKTRNVLQLGPKCELIGELLKTDQINVPVCIHHDHLSNKIIVSYTNQADIEVYDLD